MKSLPKSNKVKEMKTEEQVECINCFYYDKKECPPCSSHYSGFKPMNQNTKPKMTIKTNAKMTIKSNAKMTLGEPEDFIGNCNPLDPDSTLNASNRIINSQVINEELGLKSQVNNTQSNKYQEIDEEFDKKYTRISKGGEDEGQYKRRWFVRETTSEELLDFIHKLIDNNNKEWERKIEKYYLVDRNRHNASTRKYHHTSDKYINWNKHRYHIRVGKYFSNCPLCQKEKQ